MDVRSKFEMTIAFKSISEVCGKLSEDPSLENTKELSSALEKLSPEILDRFQSYFLVSHCVHLSTPDKYKDEVMCNILNSLINVLNHVEVSNADVFLKIYALLFIQLTDPKTPWQVLITSEELKLNVIKCVNKLIEKSSQNLLISLFSKEYYPKLCIGIYICTQLARHEKFITLRVKALECLLMMIASEETVSDEHKVRKADFVTLMLPGVISTCVAIVTDVDTINHKILVLTHRLYSRIIALVMEDEKIPEYHEMPFVLNNEQEKSEVTEKPVNIFKDNSKEWKDKAKTFKRDEKWYIGTAERLEAATRTVIKQASHPHWEVRMEMAHGVRLLLTTTSRNLQGCVGYFIDTLIIFSQDKDEPVASFSKDAIQEFGSACSGVGRRNIIDIIETNFSSLIVRLPRILHGNDLSLKEQYLLLVCGYLDILGRKHLPGILCSSHNLGRFLHCLTIAATLDSTRVSLMEEMSIRGVDMTTVNTNETGWRRLKLCETDACQLNLKKICTKLIEYSEFDFLVNSLLDTFITNITHRKEITLLLLYLMSSGPPGFLHSHVSFIQDVLDVLMDPSLWNAPVSLTSELESSRDVIQGNVVQVCLLAETVGWLAVAVGPDSFSPLLLKTLYPLLECAGSPLYVVAAAGVISLKRLSAGYGGVTSLVSFNVDYLAHHVCTRLRKASSNPTVLAVLSVIINHSNINVLPSLHEIIHKVLVQSFDTFQDINGLAFLQVFHTFVSCLLKWTPVKNDTQEATSTKTKNWIQQVEEHIKNIDEVNNLTNVEPADRPDGPFEIEPELLDDNSQPEPEKLKVPDHIKLTIDILNRSLHFLPSNDPARQIMVLQILDRGIELISGYTDELLPMVHRIWSPLVERFKSSSHPLIIQRAFSLLQTLAKHSKDFIRARTLNQVLPSLCKLLKDCSAESLKQDSTGAYTLTQKYKLQLLLLRGLGRIALDMDFTSKHVHALMEAARPYLADRQPPPLQEACIELFKELGEAHSDVVWVYLMSIYPDPLELSSGPNLPLYRFESKTKESEEYAKAVSHLLSVI